MATFNRIAGQEPSTVTFKARTIQHVQNTSNMQQEIVSLGDPNTANAIAECSSSVPTSTFVGLVTKEAGGVLSSLGGVVTIQGNSTIIFQAGMVSTSVPAATSSGVNVWIVGGNISSLSTGHVTVDNFSTTVTVAAFPANSSNVAVSALPSGLISSAAPAAGSSALVTRNVGGISSISSVAGVVTVTPNSTAATVYYPVRISDGSTWVTDYLHGSSISTPTAVAGGVSFLRAGTAAASSNDLFTMPWGSTAGHTVVTVTDSSNAQVNAGDSANNALRVNVVAGSASSTIVTVSAFGAGVISSAASAGNSSALLVRVVGGVSSAADFVSNVSSVAGVVSVTPNSTAWVKNAGFSVDSSNFLNVNASFTGSTIVTVSAFGSGLISSAASAGNSSALLVRVVGGASSAADFVSNVSSVAGVVTTTPNSTAWVKNAGLSVDSSNFLNVNASFTGSTIVTVSSLPMVSTSVPATNSSGLNVWIVGGNISSLSTGHVTVDNFSTTVSVAALPANSSNVAISAFPSGMVSTAVPATTSSGVNVWIVGGNISSLSTGHVTVDNFSTTVSVASMPANSSLVQLNAIAAGYVSTATAAANSSALNVRVVGGVSSAADFPALVTIGTNLQSSVAGSSNSSALLTRPIVDNMLTAVSTSAFATSTSFTVQSSAASIRSYVCGYSITTTNAGPTQLGFYSGATLLWAVALAAVSSAISGVNLAVSPPGYLFRTNAADPLTLQMNGSSIAGWVASVSYFRAP